MKMMNFARISSLVLAGVLSVAMGSCAFMMKETHYAFGSPTALRNQQALEFASKNRMSFQEAYRLAVDYNRTKVVNLRYEVQPVGFVVGSDFFFPLEFNNESPMSGSGFYVNPKTKRVRLGDQQSGKINLPVRERESTGVKVSLW